MNPNAKLKFFFGTMGSGKSTQALQIRHNLASRGLQVLLMTQLDRQEGRVSSRLGVSAEAALVTAETDLYDLAREHQERYGLDALVCDEAQFYAPGQIEQLAMVVDLLGVDVFAFGLLTSFQGELFPGTKRLLELADERNELQVEARCACGRRATHNARLVDGRQVYAGELKVVGDTSDRSVAAVAYELRCRFHWHEAKWESEGHQLTLPVELARPPLMNTPIEPDLPRAGNHD
jgi:thymidine kinase